MIVSGENISTLVDAPNDSDNDYALRIRDSASDERCTVFMTKCQMISLREQCAKALGEHATMGAV
jgi:hypothetical protein